jgi:hypothetical protein
MIVRYADDIVCGFEHETDAGAFLSELKARTEAFALSLHHEKTRLIEFEGLQPNAASGADWASPKPLHF